MTGVVTAAIDGNDLVVLPAFKSIQVKKIDIDNTPDPDIFLPILNKVIQAFIANINGEISRLPETRTALKIQPFGEINPAKQIKEKGTPGVEVTSNTVKGDFHLKQSAILFDDKNFQVLAEMQYGGTLIPLPKRDLDLSKKDINEEQIESAYKELATAFHDKLQNVGVEPRSNVIAWAAINKKFISSTLNQALNDIQLHLRYDTSFIPKQTFNDELKPFDHEKIDCTSTRNCPPPEVDNRDCSGNAFSEVYIPRDCTFEKKHDDRNCRVCLVPNIFTGGCSQWGNDPVCEAAKAAQNAIYEADYLAQKLDCERLKEQEKIAYEARKEAWKKQCEKDKLAQNALNAAAKLDCERLKGQEKIACEVQKEIIKRLENSGPLGRLIADAMFSGIVDTQIQKINFSQDLSEGQLDMVLSINVDMSGAIEFIPMNIIGHGVCLTKWKEPFRFNIQIPTHTRNIRWKLGEQIEQKDLTIPVIISKQDFDVTTDPPPIKEIFLEKPHLLVACPLFGPIAAVFDLYKIVKGEKDTGLFTGKFTFSIPENKDLLIPVTPMEIGLNGRTLKARPVWEKEAISFTVTE